MCGIVGCLAKFKNGFSNKDVDTFTQMLYADAVRGQDATGVFGVNKEGNVDIKKMAASSGPFISTPNYGRFKEKMFQAYQMVVGHNRKATHGEKRHEDSHPFWDKDEKLVLIHNGMVSNYKSFCDTATIDSAAIANALAEGDVEDVLSRVEGAFVFIWYNVEEKKIYFIRNEQRPLFVSETDQALYFASEDSLTYWTVTRNGNTVKKNTALKPWMLYSFDLEGRTFVEEKEITPKKKSLPVVITGTYTNITAVGQRKWIEPTLIGDAPSNYFLTTEDLPNSMAVISKLKPTDYIQIWVTSYEELSGTVNRCECTLVNVDVDFIEINMYVQKPNFIGMDLTSVFQVQIANIIERDGKITIFVRDPLAVDAIITKNDMVITDSMWNHKEFPCTCDVCCSHVTWGALPKSEIIIDKQNEFLLLCERCT